MVLRGDGAPIDRLPNSSRVNIISTIKMSIIFFDIGVKTIPLMSIEFHDANNSINRLIITVRFQ